MKAIGLYWGMFPKRAAVSVFFGTDLVAKGEREGWTCREPQRVRLNDRRSLSHCRDWPHVGAKPANGGRGNKVVNFGVNPRSRGA